MKRFVFVCFYFVVVVGMLCNLIAASEAQHMSKGVLGQRFSFKYETGHPLVYSMGTKMGIDMDINAETENINTKMICDMRYQVTLTPTATSKQGVITMRLEPSNIEADWNITGPGGHIVISLRGADMKGTLNDVVIIDTAKDIGTDQAQEFKKEILPLYLSGQVDIDEQGNIKQFRGDLPFVEFWTDATLSQLGFFGIVFPNREVAVGNTWQEKISLKKMGQVKLEGEGLRCTVTFTRQPDEVVQGKHLAVFKLSAPFIHKDLTGFMEQMGQITRLNISQFDRRATGTIRFDQDKGLLIDSTTKVDANASMNALIQGQAVTMDLKVDADIRLVLIAEKPKVVQPSTAPYLEKKPEAMKEFTISEFKPEHPDAKGFGAIYELSQEDPTEETIKIHILAGTMSVRERGLVVLCEGATHIIKGKVIMEGYTFESDATDPLQFKVDKDKGYVYLKGKGTVTGPDKKTIKLPQSSIVEKRIPFSKKPVVIQSLPEEFSERVEITFQEDKNEWGIKRIIRIPPKVKHKKGSFIYEGTGSGDTVVEKNFKEGFLGSEFDGEIIKIGPNLKIALSQSESIVSGDKGATLKRVKVEKGIILIEGEAWLILIELEKGGQSK